MTSNERKLSFESPLGKHTVWTVWYDNICLGIIDWIKQERSYYFYVYTHDSAKPLSYKSLREIANFCEHETLKRLERRKVISDKIRSKYK